MQSTKPTIQDLNLNLHTHANKNALDLLTVNNDVLQYNGQVKVASLDLSNFILSSGGTFNSSVERFTIKNTNVDKLFEILSYSDQWTNVYLGWGFGGNSTVKIIDGFKHPTLGGYTVDFYAYKNNEQQMVWHEGNSFSYAQINNLVANKLVDGTTPWTSCEPSFTKNSAFNKNFGTTAGTVCQGNDSRLSNARTPLAHIHNASDINAGTGTIDVARLPIGTTGMTVALGDHTHSYLPLTGGIMEGGLNMSENQLTLRDYTISGSTTFINQPTYTVTHRYLNIKIGSLDVLKLRRSTGTGDQATLDDTQLQLIKKGSLRDILTVDGGTLSGILTAQNNVLYNTKQVRNITLSTANPSGGSNGDIWFKYI